MLLVQSLTNTLHCGGGGALPLLVCFEYLFCYPPHHKNVKLLPVHSIQLNNIYYTLLLVINYYNNNLFHHLSV